MPPKFPYSTKNIFQPTKLDEFIQKRINKLPKDLPEPIKRKLLLDAKYLSDHGEKTQDPAEAIKGISKKKKDKQAYPNFDSYMYIQPSRDVKKWIQAVRDFYFKVHTGQDRTEALKSITAGWDTM